MSDGSKRDGAGTGLFGDRTFQVGRWVSWRCCGVSGRTTAAGPGQSGDVASSRSSCSGAPRTVHR